MAKTIWFTSAVPHGNTQDVGSDPVRTTRFELRESQDDETFGETEYVIYVRGVGEFTTTDLNEMRNLFAYLSNVAVPMSFSQD